MAVLNAILGKETKVEKFRGSSTELIQTWLDGLSKDEFFNATDLLSRTSDQLQQLYRSMSETHKRRFKAIFGLVASMLGDAQLTASAILQSALFHDIPVPVNAYPEGLDSVPEGEMRERITACLRLPWNRN